MEEKRVTHEEVLMCGYKRCCPTVRQFDDGSIEISDDDAANGSVGVIKIGAESVARLRELIKEK